MRPSSMSAKLLLALAICVISASPAGARTLVYGSSLRPAATIAEAHQADTAFWPTARALRAPATGQIVRIRLQGTAVQSGAAPAPAGRSRRPRWKGTAVPSRAALAPAPLNQVHFQHLRPLSRGRMFALQS